MSDRHPLLARAAVFVGALATLRIGLFAFLDKSPRYGGSEANELRLLMRYHLPFQYPSSQMSHESPACGGGRDSCRVVALPTLPSPLPTIW